MSAYPRIHGKIPFVVGIGLICLPGILNAQTGAERVRAEERARAVERARTEELTRAKVLRERLEQRLQFTEQETLEKLAEAESRIQQELAIAKEHRLQLTEQEKLERLAESESRIHEELNKANAVREARAQEVRRMGQERAREVETRVRAVQEAHQRTQEAFQGARQEARRAQQVMVQVKSRVRLGVSLDGTQGEDYNALGARLTGTLEDSPAEEAGLREGDIITHLNGQSLLDPIPQEEQAEFDDEESLPVQRLIAMAEKLEAGEDVEVRYLRDGSPQTVSFQTEERDEPTITVLRGAEGKGGVFRVLRSPGGKAVVRLDPDRGGEGSPLLYSLGGSSAGFGLDLAEMNPGLAEYFTADEGLLVLEVQEDSSLGLVPGDVILFIDGRAVENQGDVRRILGSYEEDETVSFTVIRKGRETMVEGRIG